MSLTHDIITTNTIRLQRQADSLYELARAFRRTGNQHVAEELEAIEEAVHRSAEAIHNAYYDKVTTETEQSIQNSQRFIGAVLLGLMSGKDPKDACLEGMTHHFDRDLIEENETL